MQSGVARAKGGNKTVDSGWDGGKSIGKLRDDADKICCRIPNSLYLLPNRWSVAFFDVRPEIFRRSYYWSKGPGLSDAFNP